MSSDPSIGAIPHLVANKIDVMVEVAATAGAVEARTSQSPVGEYLKENRLVVC